MFVKGLIVDNVNSLCSALDSTYLSGLFAKFLMKTATKPPAMYKKKGLVLKLKAFLSHD